MCERKFGGLKFGFSPKNSFSRIREAHSIIFSQFAEQPNRNHGGMEWHHSDDMEIAPPVIGDWKPLVAVNYPRSSFSWVKQPGWFQWDFCGGKSSTYNWGELTHLRFVGWTTKHVLDLRRSGWV